MIMTTIPVATGGFGVPPPFCGRSPQMKILPYDVMFKALKPLKDTTLIISCLIMSVTV